MFIPSVTETNTWWDGNKRMAVASGDFDRLPSGSELPFVGCLRGVVGMSETKLGKLAYASLRQTNVAGEAAGLPQRLLQTATGPSRSLSANQAKN